MRFLAESKWRVVKDPKDIPGGSGCGSWIGIGAIVTVWDDGYPANIDPEGDVTIWVLDRDDKAWIHPDCLEPLGWNDRRDPEDMVE